MFSQPSRCPRAIPSTRWKTCCSPRTRRIGARTRDPAQSSFSSRTLSVFARASRWKTWWINMLDINVTTEVTFEDIRAAAERIRPTAKRTPVMTSRSFDAEAGVAAFFKCENLQTGGAFKIRGASNFIFSIPKDQLGKGVVAHSSGNHAQAVAIAAQFVGAPATLVMPEDAPRAKLEGTRARGARIVAYNRFTDDRTGISARIAAETGATLVPPYDHPWTIAGQGTAAKELLEEVPDLDAMVVCVGGGGLMSGSSIAAHHLNPKIRMFGVEPELANDTYLSFEAGKRVKIDTPGTIADGLRSTSPGELTFPILRKHLEKVL